MLEITLYQIQSGLQIIACLRASSGPQGSKHGPIALGLGKRKEEDFFLKSREIKDYESKVLQQKESREAQS